MRPTHLQWTALFAASVLVVAAGCSDTTAPAAAPAAPAGVSVSRANDRVELAWPAVAKATSYNIYWSKTTGVTPSNGTKISNATSPYTQTGLTDGTTYYYVVTALEGSHESRASAQVSATPAAVSAPVNIHAEVITVAGGTNVLGYLENVQVHDSAGAIVTNATVTVNGSALAYNAAAAAYQGTVAIATGGAVDLSVVAGSATYTASATQFTTIPTVSSPSSGTTWHRTSANPIVWTAGAPTSGASYTVAVLSSSGSCIFPTTSADCPTEIATTATTDTIATNAIASAGSYQLAVGIATTGISASIPGAGIPIPNAAAGSAMFLLGVRFVPITVQ